jgi:hypothetical protein
MAEAEGRARPVAVTVSSGAPGMPTELAQTAVPPVKVDGRNRRSDDDALEGGFARVESADSKHDGTIGVFESVVSYGDDGYPEEVLFRTRDSASQLVSIPYDQLRPTPEYRGGR